MKLIRLCCQRSALFCPLVNRFASSFTSRFPVPPSGQANDVITNVNVQLLGQYTGLTSFSEEDIKNAYTRLSGGEIGNATVELTEESVTKYVREHYTHLSLDDQVVVCRSLLYELTTDSSGLTKTKSLMDFTKMLSSTPVMHSINGVENYPANFDQSVSYPEFQSKIRSIGENIDIRVWPVALSNTLAGISIGIMVPCMPMLVKQIDISPSQFGVVVSAFGVAKLISNIPAGYLVDIKGRKPMMVWGMGLIGVSIAGAGCTLFPGFGVPWLIFCRLNTGMYLAGISAGAQMYITDISNQLNRARMFVPLQTSFNLGMIFGPVLGGGLIQVMGISNTFFLVGSMCISIGVLNHRILIETMARHVGVGTEEDRGGASLVRDVANSFGNSFAKWRQLLTDNKELRKVVALNSAYWFVLCGTQFTLLPIILYQPPFEFSAVEIGGLFAYMSGVTVLASPYVARLADKFDKVYTMLGCSTLLGMGILGIPFASSAEQLLAALTPMVIGSTGLGILPVAYSSDIVSTTDRAQAQSLIRTFGDVGFVGGATAGGLVADLISIPATLYGNSSLVISGALAWFIVRRNATKGNTK